MLKRYLALVALSMLAAPLFAEVLLQTSINDVFHRGSNELAGSITMTIKDDDFANASTSEPVYIRITLDHLATLSETLVNQSLPPGDYRRDPVFLAMNLNAGGGLRTISADPETVSIVRWVAGESALWIRVQSGSDNWIDFAGFPEGPTEDNTVTWEFGISARSSWSENSPNFPPGTSNLPFNTRDAATAGDEEDATSTLICVNLVNSDLTTSGVESTLNFDPIAFDEQADIGGGQYSGQAGNDTGINFSDDRVIARGKSRECTVDVISPKFGAGDTLLCIPRAGTNQTLAGFIQAHNTITYEVDCRRDGNFLDTSLFAGAYVTLTTDPGGTYGFDGDNAAHFVSLPGFGDVNGASAFNSHGSTLYRSIDVVYNGPTVILDSFQFSVEAWVTYHYTDGPTDIIIEWWITLVNHDGEFDDPPFDGIDQVRRCPPSEFMIAHGTWDFGRFVECQGVPAALFFPYLPKIRNSLFWSGLSLVNQGFINFGDGDVVAYIYQEDGARFSADFPALPVRNQYTWLLVDDGIDTGFFGTGGQEGTTIIPVPTDGGPADAFGDTRMSMFVVGSFVAEFTDDIFAGDLDGYLLIGSGTDVDGSYLPRNYDNDIPGQNADLPLRRSKNANGLNARVLKNEIGAVQPAKYEFNQGRWTNKPSNR